MKTGGGAADRIQTSKPSRTSSEPEELREPFPSVRFPFLPQTHEKISLDCTWPCLPPMPAHDSGIVKRGEADSSTFLQRRYQGEFWCQINSCVIRSIMLVQFLLETSGKLQFRPFFLQNHGCFFSFKGFFLQLFHSKVVYLNFVSWVVHLKPELNLDLSVGSKTSPSGPSHRR